MVNLALPFIILFSPLIYQIVAAPSTAAGTVVASPPKDTRFSFADWVDTIIADPEAALKPTEAVQAFVDSMNATESAHSSSSNGFIEKRWDSKVGCGYDDPVFDSALVITHPEFLLFLATFPLHLQLAT